MENKYYTPEISEFSIGFEYEVVYEDNSVDKYMFGEDLENADGFIPWITPDYFLKLLSENKIRAKYLDQEDIESLGWEVCASSGDYTEFNLKSEPTYNTFLSIGIGYKIIDNYNVKICNNLGDNIMFQGTIKNKSELKKLMQMLNIQTNAE